MRILLTLVMALSTASTVFGQCTQGNGRHADVNSVQLILQGFSSTTAIEQGMNMWNATGCNQGGDDFPFLQLAPGADATLTVRWEPGYNPTNDRSCGNINHDTQIISLYGQVRDEQGLPRNCALDGIVADNFAHEIGHYFGLGHSDCLDYIMAPAGFRSTGTYIDRAVQGDECTFADTANQPPNENLNENPPPDPFCDAYCWTSCVNNVCPERTTDTGCPILVDLENDGIRLTGLDDPVWFDIDADGAPDLMSWTDRGEGLLALDRNGNGAIDSGGELFGDHTRLADGSRALNGYLALAELDTWLFGGNGDDFIDASDDAFGSLWLWTDRNHDGTSQPDELQTPAEAGILRIALKYRRSNRTDRYGNTFQFLGRAWKEGRNGVVRPVLTWDVFFVVAP